MEKNKPVLSQKLESDKQRLVTVIDKVIEVTKQSEERMQIVEKSLNETQGYLGEEKTRNRQLENDLQGKNQYIQKIEEDFKILKQQSDEAQWYLVEEKTKNEQLENALKNSLAKSQGLESQLDQLRIQLQTVQNEYHDTQWFLGEERAKHAVR